MKLITQGKNKTLTRVTLNPPASKVQEVWFWAQKSRELVIDGVEESRQVSSRVGGDDVVW